MFSFAFFSVTGINSRVRRPTRYVDEISRRTAYYRFVLPANNAQMKNPTGIPAQKHKMYGP